MSTQLRLVESPTKQPKRGGTHAPKARAKTTTRGARRAVHWGAWELDDHTRRIGRAGVAAARQALEAARVAQELRQAS
ncbi:MAG: hypothetical protein WD271_03870 [Acidimicrobiia bacterium]